MSYSEQRTEGEGEGVVVVTAATKDQLDAARALFGEYVRSLGVDIEYQGCEAELASLPGKYVPPEGCLLLAKADGVYVGCVALRKLSEGICEMKRLYVRPSARGMGGGALLVNAIVAEAERLGYGRMRLDSLESLGSALRLYERHGFVRIDAYCFNPLPGAVYMERVLDIALERHTLQE